MSEPILFVDRDGTLVEEPSDGQIDSVTKIRFMPGVFAALNQLAQHGYRLVMITNQDGLGTQSFPRASFDEAHTFLIEAFASQGIRFDAVLICPHRQEEGCACRKPQTGLLDDWLRDKTLDRERSAVVGDRDTDLELATNLGVQGIAVMRGGSEQQTWPHVTRTILSRRCEIVRMTKETHVRVRVNLDAPEPIQIATGIGFFDHMLEQLARHAGFSLSLSCKGDLHIDEHHTVEDTALTLGEALRRALGSKLGIARYGFVLPMDESEARVALDLSGRGFSTFSGKLPRESVGQLHTELVPHFFRSLSDALGGALHITVRGENTHHMIEACFKSVGRSLRQAMFRVGSVLPTTKGVM